ncbi:hypothetical protein [Serinicoccus kebangsaanensis]|uniref:hypothetical protein n=1 Tax=Serinicoccus kebangsaanensis TaxID=2602069 RepID=UPI00124BFD5E|nr:hypothetical protein [Serinicoccus kebangsaanensis]
MTIAQIRHRLDKHSWQQVFRATYVTHTGQVTWLERVEAAVLARGAGAVVSLRCALHLWDLTSDQPAIITLAEHFDTHRTSTFTGVKTRRRRRLTVARRHGLPLTTLPQTIIDVIALRPNDIDGAMALITRAVSSRKVTVAELRAELVHHPRHPARDVLTEALMAAEDGLGSAAEARYVRDVETAHGLPRMCRQDPIGGADGRALGRTMDFRDRARALGVEIDGALWHREKQLADRRRDREAVGEGGVVLRAGWVEVVSDPCRLAADVAAAQQARGWTGSPRPCGHTCAIALDSRWARSG